MVKNINREKKKKNSPLILPTFFSAQKIKIKKVINCNKVSNGIGIVKINWKIYLVFSVPEYALYRIWDSLRL